MPEDMNYYDTFIQVADDCPVDAAEVPPRRGDKLTVAAIHHELIARNPYRYTQEDVLFETHAIQRGIPATQQDAERQRFFSRGQPCLRSSPLGKRYGWGIHNDAQGRVALYAVESPEYQRLLGDPALKHLKAMRSKRA